MRLNFIFIIILLIFINLKAQHELVSHEFLNKIITLFIDKYPTKIKTKLEKEQIEEFCKKNFCKTLNIPANVGIFLSYAGYLNISDHNGQVIFPRKTVRENFNLLVTNKIFPVFMLKNTIAYWQIDSDAHSKMYNIQRKQDEETELYYWDVNQRDLPKSNKIPIHTIIIFSDPEKIEVPIGITPTAPTSQLLLPTIFAKPDLSYTQNALYVMTIRPFYSSIHKLFKDRPFGYMVNVTD